MGLTNGCYIHDQANITVFGHQALLLRNLKAVDRASRLQEGSAVKFYMAGELFYRLMPNIYVNCM